MFIDDSALCVNNPFMHETMERIWIAIEPTGMSWADFARAMRTDNQNVNNWKKRGISKSRIAEAARVTGTSADYIMTGEVKGAFSATLANEEQQNLASFAGTEAETTISLLQGTSPETQKLINDILKLEAEGSFNGVVREMVQNAVDAIPHKPNKSAASFRNTHSRGLDSKKAQDKMHGYRKVPKQKK